LVEQICSYLVPIDLALVKLYSLVMVAFATVVLVKWCVNTHQGAPVEQQVASH
jgi:hypothetical protein